MGGAGQGAWLQESALLLIVQSHSGERQGRDVEDGSTIEIEIEGWQLAARVL